MRSFNQILQKFNSSFIISIVFLTAFFSPKLFADPIFRINNSTNQVINKFDFCRNVTNASGKDIMVATNTKPEWSSFLSHLPTGVTAPVYKPYSPAVSGFACNSVSNTVTMATAETLVFTAVTYVTTLYVNGSNVGDITTSGLSYSFSAGDTFKFYVQSCVPGTSLTIQCNDSSGDTIETLFDPGPCGGC